MIDRLVHGEDAGFIADLANAMRQVAGSRRRFPLPDGKRRLHGEGRMTDVHSTILAWFLQGGRASAARVWSRATPPAGCDACLDRPRAGCGLIGVGRPRWNMRNSPLFALASRLDSIPALS